MIIAGMLLLATGGVGFFCRIVMGPSLADRVIAVDGLVVTIVAAIILNAIRTESDWFLDVALVVAFVGFVGTTAGGRFIERRGG
jgi:multisubunit Na+/H+ antiporter MnhF subunit